MDERLELVRRWWYEVWGEGDLDRIPELTTDPFTRHGQSGTVRRTHAELASDMQQYRRVLSGCVPTFESQFAEGDHVFSRILTTGLNLETEEAMVVHWLQEHRIEHGKLAETWVLYTFSPGWERDGKPPPPPYPSAGVG